jgi:hypothetical protein
MAYQDATTADGENDTPSARVPRKWTTTKPPVEENPSFDTDQLPAMSGKKVAALSIIVVILLLMVVQVILTAMDLSANLQTRDNIKQTRELQICEGNINLTASSQTDATQKLKACLAAQN